MTFSRRSFLGLTAAAAASAAGGLSLPASARRAPALASAPLGSPVSPAGDVVGKLTTGYQGWFAARGDGAEIDLWWHWAAGNNAKNKPSPTNTSIISWPDMRGYEKTYATDYPNLGNGQPATLFSSWDQQTVDLHLADMARNGIHTAALQRFKPFDPHEGPFRDGVTPKVRSAAEKHGVKFYIMYDISGWPPAEWKAQIKQDWTEKMSKNVASSSYAKQNNRPVVGIWGFGFPEESTCSTPPTAWR